MATFNYILTNLNTGAIKTLTAAPAGWADSTERKFRSVKYNTVLSSDALSQRFPNVDGELFDHGGYWLILNAYLADGLKALVKYERQILNNYSQEYEDDYIGMLDFSVDSGWSHEPGKWFDIKTIDARKLAKFIARDEIEYDIFGLVSSDNITVPDFINPYQEATYKKVDIYLDLASNGDFFVNTDTWIIDNGTAGTFTPYWGVVTKNEIPSRIEITNEDPSLTIYTNSTDFDATIQNIEVSGLLDVNYAVTPSVSSWQLHIYLYITSLNEDGVIEDTQSINIASRYGSSDADSGRITESYDFNFNDMIVPPNGYLVVALKGSEVDLVEGVILGFPSTEKVYNLSFTERTLGWPDNIIKGMMVNEAAERLIQLMTSETDTSKLLDAPIIGRTDSDFTAYSANGLMSLEHVTNGYQLRQLVDNAINLSFTDLFTSLSAIRPLGLWFDKDNDIFIIDEVSTFYKDEQFPTHLGYVNNLKITPATELCFSTIYTGFPKTVYEDFSGARELNTETEHGTSIETKTDTTIRSIALQETIGVELTRRKNISLYESEDTKLDDSIFITTVDETKTTIQGGLDNASGIVNIDEYYNLKKTPRQNLQRWGVILEAPYYFDESEVTQFIKSAKSNNISYIDPDSGLSVNEFDNLEQTHINSKLMLPEVYEFEAIYNKQIRDELREDPHRYYAFYDANGNELYGYINPSVEGNAYKGEATYILTRANINRS